MRPLILQCLQNGPGQRQGSGRGCLGGAQDIAFGSDGLLYVVDSANKRVSVWSKEGTFKGHFKAKYDSSCIAATSATMVLASANSHTVMVYTCHLRDVVLSVTFFRCRFGFVLHCCLLCLLT